ncbi:MAG: hypothetical protein Q8P67_08095 [archaeon]|nr:hypothetical protein [archaeon]
MSMDEQQAMMMLQAMMAGPSKITPQARADGFDELKRRLTVFTFFVISARFILPTVCDYVLR